MAHRVRQPSGNKNLLTRVGNLEVAGPCSTTLRLHSAIIISFSLVIRQLLFKLIINDYIQL